MKSKNLKIIFEILLVSLLIFSIIPSSVFAEENEFNMSSGLKHTVVLDENHEAWVWGSNRYGQFGNGTTIDTNYSFPVKIEGISNIKKVKAGRNNTMLITESGDVWVCGRNNYGQLGDGTTTDRHNFVKINRLSNIIDIEISGSYGLALTSSGEIFTWGDNAHGELGNGTTINNYNPTKVSGVYNVKEIKAGYSNLILKKSGDVWTWGSNYRGEIGDYTNIDRYRPVKVLGLSNISTIEKGEFTNYAMSDSGEIWAWGSNSSRELGNGTTVSRNYPAKINGLTNIKTISAGVYYAIALTNDGKVIGWGSSNYGELGVGRDITYFEFPTLINTISNVSKITSGGLHTIAILNNGEIWSWGYNTSGQLGNGTRTIQYIPVKASNLQFKPLGIGNSITDLIQTAIDTPTQENIDAVWQAIFITEDLDEQETLFSEFISNDTIFEDAYNQVLLAKETEKRTDIVSSIDKVNLVSEDNPYKNGLQSDSNNLKLNFNKKVQYGDFDKLSQYYVDRANYFTNLIDNEAQRAPLMTRVNVIADKMYSKVDRFALEIATKYVEYSELYNKQDLKDKATILVNTLNDSTYKTNLLSRLNNF